MTSELRPVALMHTHDDEFTEFEEYRNGSGCLTQADKDAGWTETPLYTLEAVRAEQAAELAKFKALAETLAGALEQYDQGCAVIGGCSDGYCVIQRPKGMHTNGGCRCSDDRNRMRRFASRASYFREKVADALRQWEEATQCG